MKNMKLLLAMGLMTSVAFASDKGVVSETGQFEGHYETAIPTSGSSDLSGPSAPSSFDAAGAAGNAVVTVAATEAVKAGYSKLTEQAAKVVTQNVADAAVQTGVEATTDVLVKAVATPAIETTANVVAEQATDVVVDSGMKATILGYGASVLNGLLSGVKAPFSKSFYTQTIPAASSYGRTKTVDGLEYVGDKIIKLGGKAASGVVATPGYLKSAPSFVIDRFTKGGNTEKAAWITGGVVVTAAAGYGIYRAVTSERAKSVTTASVDRTKRFGSWIASFNPWAKTTAEASVDEEKTA